MHRILGWADKHLQGRTASAAPVARAESVHAAGDGSALIRGIGLAGSPSMDIGFLARHGCNAIRTWGLDQLPSHVVKECERHGMQIYAGLWIENPSATRADEIVAQFEQARAIPSVTCVLIGNEVECRSDKVAALTFINEIARRCRKLDSRVLLGTAIADPGDSVAALVMKHCPDIDILAVNVYGGIANLEERLRRQGMTKPWFLGEFGTPGHWEMPQTPWGMAIEPGTEDRRRHFDIRFKSDLYRGSFAFLGGYKIECTPTWFSMILPAASPLVLYDKMVMVSKFWGNPCPAIPMVSLTVEPSTADSKSRSYTCGAAGGNPVGWVQAPAGCRIVLRLRVQGTASVPLIAIQNVKDGCGIDLNVRYAPANPDGTYDREFEVASGPHRIWWVCKLTDDEAVSFCKGQGVPALVGSIPCMGT